MEGHAGSRHLEILLLHELSAGTFARLYLAEARAPGGIERIVAVKILREQWNESAEVINRTRDEARLLARLRHKNILRVEDLSEIDGQLAIIMEFVDGLDLKQLVEALAKQRRRVPPRVALQIAAEAASALEAAYFKVPYGLDAPLHVVHRDIKPSNVMVSVEGEVKVLDFGTARSSQAFRSVQTGALRFGSLKYMSPERREGDRGEHAADVYALGLMLLEILKGEWLPLLPMDVQEHDETVADEVSRLGSLGMPNREWDVALRQVLLQMMAGEAELRPNAEQVAKLLRAFAEQAAGETLDTFAHESLAPIARQIRGNLTGGALAGTRFVVNWTPSDAQARGAAPAPSPTPPPAPARAQEQAAAALAAPAARTFDQDDESPTYAGVAAGVPAANLAPTRTANPAPARPAAPVSAGPAPSPVSSAPAPTAPAPTRPAPVEHSRPRAAVVEDDPFDAPPPKKGGNMALAAGGAFALLVFGCAGLAGIGGLVYWLRGADAAREVPAGTATAGASATPSAPVASPPPGAAGSASAAGTSPLTVAMEGAPVQWVRVHTVMGQQVLTGDAPLEGKVAADTYELSLKQVGRPALKGTIVVPDAGLSLVCSPQKDATVQCTGAGAPVVLAP